MEPTAVSLWKSEQLAAYMRSRVCVPRSGTRLDRLRVMGIDNDPEVIAQLAMESPAHDIDMCGCPDPIGALLLVGRTCPDAIVLGPITNGGLDALEFLRVVRTAEPDLPIVFGVDSSQTAAAASDAGASAILPRPYVLPELFALVRAIARQHRNLPPQPAPINLGRLRIDAAMQQIWLDGNSILLSPMEFRLLRYLAERSGAVVARTELISQVWGPQTTARSNTLTVHVRRLRRRLGDDDNNPQWIKAVRGLGYQFNVPPKL